MLIACGPRPPLGAAEEPAADRDEDCPGAKPLHRLPVALRVAGDAALSVELVAAAAGVGDSFATELAKTAC